MDLCIDVWMHFCIFPVQMPFVAAIVCKLASGSHVANSVCDNANAIAIVRKAVVMSQTPIVSARHKKLNFTSFSKAEVPMYQV